MYAAPADIRFALAPDGSLTGTAAELDDDQLNAHIRRAQNLVDGYTATPFNDSNVPDLLKDLVVQLASFYATLAYRKGKELLATHPVYLSYMDAQRTLTGIKNGTIEFEPPTADPDNPPQRRKPKINNAWRSSAELFPMREFGMEVTCGDEDNEGYLVTQDPATSNTGFA